MILNSPDVHPAKMLGHHILLDTPAFCLLCALTSTSYQEVRFHVCLLQVKHQIFFLSFLSNTGTRIIYDRKFLLDCRNSPLARTPPCCLPQIPGVTVPATHPMGKLQDLKEEAEEEEEKDIGKRTTI